MPSWLVDDPSLVFILLCTLALVLGVLWWRTRKRPYLLGAGVAVVLLAGVWLLGHFVETDAKQIERKIREMAASVGDRNLDRAFAHISQDFHFGNSGRQFDRQLFRQRAQEFISTHRITEAVVWDFEPGEVSRAQRTGQMAFKVKVRSDLLRGGEHYRCVADFVLDPDGQWRLRSFQLFNPFVETNQPFQIPGF
jgi:hypothetical protein